MMREGVYEHYKCFGINRDTELEWLRELQAAIIQSLNQTSNNKDKAKLFSEYGDVVAQMNDVQGIHFMLEFIKNNAGSFDSHSILRNVSSILNSIDFINNAKQKSTIVKETLSLLKNNLCNPIWVSNDYKENGEMPDYLSKDRVLSNIKQKIKFMENL